jgi:Tfp pilus assembly protein PilN
MDLATFTQRIRRADFLDGLGIYVEPEQVSLAHVSKRFLHVVLRHARSAPLPPTSQPEERLQALTRAVSAFVRETGVEPTAVHLCLSRQELLLNRLVLPAAARESLGQVLEYEIERVIPLPRDEVFYDYQLRESGDREAGRLAVLVLCVPQRVVRQYVGALEVVGMRPKAVVVAAGALGDYVAFCRGALEAPTALLLQTGAERELALFLGGRLIASHALRPGTAATQDAVMALCRRDLGEVFHASEGPIDLLVAGGPSSDGSAETADAATHDLRRLSVERLETPPGFVDAAEPSLLPAVGAALGAVREGVVGINLLPEEHRPGFQEGLFVPLVLTVVVLVLTVIYGGSVILRDEMVRRTLAREVETLEPQVKTVRAEETEVQQLQEQISVLTADEDRRIVQFLRELTQKVPTDAYLTTMRFRNDRVEIDGFADRSSELIQVLEASSMFRSVKFTSPVTSGQGNKERFSIVAELER